MIDPNRSRLVETARALGDLKERIVFIGGSVVGLHVTDPGSASVRPTADVDAIVDAASRTRYEQVTRQLEERGFQQDRSGPICRI